MASASSSTDIQQLFTVEGLVAVITGGGSGLGAMMAGALENNGATVYILGRRKEALEKTIAERAVRSFSSVFVHTRNGSRFSLSAMAVYTPYRRT